MTAKLFGDLVDHRAMSVPNLRMIERRHVEAIAQRVDDLQCPHISFVPKITTTNDGGSILLDRLAYLVRCLAGDHNLAVHAQLHCRVSGGQTCVPTRTTHHLGVALGFRLKTTNEKVATRWNTTEHLHVYRAD